MRGFIISAHKTIGVVSFVLIMAGAVALLAWGDHFDVMKLRCMWLGLVLVRLAALVALRGAMLRGLRKVVLGQLPEQIDRPIVLVALVLLLPLVDTDVETPAGVMVRQIIAIDSAFSVGLQLFRKYWRPQLARPFRTSHFLETDGPKNARRSQRAGINRHPCDRNRPEVDGGQGRNQITDTRIFSALRPRG